jgi:hypothetical protein
MLKDSMTIVDGFQHFDICNSQRIDCQWVGGKNNEIRLLANFYRAFNFFLRARS